MDDPVEVRLGGHAEHRLDRFGVDVVAADRAGCRGRQHVAGAGRGVGLALDLHAVAARGDVDAEPLLDRDQMPVVIAEQRPEQVGLVELQLEPGARLGNGGEVAAGHQAATCSRAAPAMLFGPAATSVTSMMSPGCASVSTWTDCSQGDVPIIWPWQPALALDQHLRVAARPSSG